MTIRELEKPAVPETWDYHKSVDKVKAVIYKWTHLTVEIANELFIAREQLSVSGGVRTSGKKLPLTWTGYCEEIGSERHTVNNWLRRFFGVSQLEEPGESIQFQNLTVRMITIKCFAAHYNSLDPTWIGKCEGNCVKLKFCRDLDKMITEHPILVKAEESYIPDCQK